MKTISILIFVLLSLVSCGKNTEESSLHIPSVSPLKLILKEEEAMFVKKLIDRKYFSRQELLKEFLLLNDMDEMVLVRINTHVKLTCLDKDCTVDSL